MNSLAGYIDSPPDPAPPDRAGVQQSSWKFGSYGGDGCSTGRGSSLGGSGGGSNNGGERGGTLSRAGRRTPLSQTKTDASIASSGNNSTAAGANNKNKRKNKKNNKLGEGDDDRVNDDDGDLDNSGECGFFPLHPF
jgi:hypothetical protein